MRDLKRKLGLLLILKCIHVTQSTCPKMSDKLCVKDKGPYGESPSFDADKKEFCGETAMTMITAIRVNTYEYNSINYISCVGFTYADKENPCPKKTSQGTKTHDTPLEPDEYVIEVTGSAFSHIRVISFITNKKNTIGPYGAEFKYTDVFTAKNDGKPLLYVSGLAGSWVYQLTFYFSCLGELELDKTVKTVATETMNKLQSKIEELTDVHNDYKRMLPDIAKHGCYDFPKTQSKESENACDLRILLQQLKILVMSSNSLISRQPRNLLFMKDYDSGKFLNEVKEAHDFHKLLINIKFDLQTVIKATAELGRKLGAYFKKTAEFDIDIANEDKKFLEGRLNNMKNGANEATKEVSDRLSRVLGFAVGMSIGHLEGQLAKLAVTVISMFNPFKTILDPDPTAIMDRMDDVMQAVRQVAKAGTLLKGLEEFKNYMAKVMDRFLENRKQLVGLKEVVYKSDNLADDAKMEAMSDTFVTSYGNYSPKVTNQDLAYIAALLQTVADAGCQIVEQSTSGMRTAIIGTTYESVSQDCTYIGPNIEKLKSYYDDWYSFQFELIDSLTKIVRGNISKHMAKKMSNTSAVIDVQTAAIGSVITQIKYQAASVARCNILEYNDGGKRPEVCKKLLFRDDDIQKLIAYKGSVQHSNRKRSAYIPSSKPGASTSPYIDVDRLLKGEIVHFQLPLNDKAWMEKYEWIPKDYPETAYFVQYFEVYIPGLKCENGRPLRVQTEVRTGKSTQLYPTSAVPSYIVPRQFLIFAYADSIATCDTRSVHQFLIRNSADVISPKRVCVHSEGKVTDYDDKDKTLPSLFSTFSIKMRKIACKVVRDKSLPPAPFVTVRLHLKEVYAKVPGSNEGIDDCWPKPCPSNQSSK